MNTDETQSPWLQTNPVINTGETIIPEALKLTNENKILSPGTVIGNDYIINSMMNEQGKQSNVYLAKRWGKSYVVKIYHNDWQPSPEIQRFLSSINHPNLAHIVECGKYDGHYYEIYEYYSEGMLEKTGALPVSHIQNVIIPSINEGLNALHKNGIMHCDIKPSNLFYADGESKVVIGDYGISGYINSNGKMIDVVRGTPEYAPPVKTLLRSASISPAYDYGSFGLVLCRTILGYSLFKGMSEEEILKAWDNGLDLPSPISGRLSNLIRGLLNEDEEQRWGYIQVKRWCEGEFRRPVNRNIYSRIKKEQKIHPLIYGRFNGETLVVTSLYQLEQAIINHWEQAINVIRRHELKNFIRQFDDSVVEKIIELDSCHDPDTAVYKLLTYIANDKRRICFCGKVYNSLTDYIEQLSTGRDDIAKKFLDTGLLIFYLRYNEYDKTMVDKLEESIMQNHANDLTLILTICFELQGKRKIDVYGSPVETLDDLIPILCKCSIKEIDTLLDDEHFIAWLNRLGYEKETYKMKEISK